MFPCPIACDKVVVTDDDGVDYEIPVLDNRACLSEGRAFEVQVDPPNSFELFNFQTAVTNSAFRTIPALCRNREAYLLTGVAQYFNRLLDFPDEYGFAVGNVEIFYNRGEGPLREGAVQCYLACFFCDGGGPVAANTSGVGAANAMLAVGRPARELAGNLLEGPLLIGQEDQVVYQWSPSVAARPNRVLIPIVTFCGFRLGGACLPNEVKIPGPRERGSCEDAEEKPPASVIRLLGRETEIPVGRTRLERMELGRFL